MEDDLRECPFCGGAEYRGGATHRVMGHGDSGTETHLECLGCGAIFTFRGYYNTFDPAKFNRRAMPPGRCDHLRAAEEMSRGSEDYPPTCPITGEERD